MIAEPFSEQFTSQDNRNEPSTSQSRASDHDSEMITEPSSEQSTSQDTASELTSVQFQKIALETTNQPDYDREYAKYIQSFSVKQKDGSRRFVYCKLCNKYPDIVRINSDNPRLPNITTETGIRFKKEYVVNHFSSLYHRKCKEAERASNDDSSTKNKALMDVHISEANRKRANHVGELLLQVYCDAKKLTLSANSWPPRYVAAKAGQSFDFNTTTSTIPDTIDIQYVNGPTHLNLLEVITRSYQSIFKETIANSLASSIHIDGSVDRTQIDKIYILLKIVNRNGDLKTLFIGIGQQQKRGAVGLIEAVKNGIKNSAGDEIYRLIFSRVSSICTDGTNVNTGEKHSLWKYFEEECLKYRSDLPLNKFWCSAHRMELVWGDLTNRVKEVKRIVEILSSISSYFHESGLRTDELKKIATEHSLKLLSIPKIFKIRWTEWTYTTVVNLLKSWNSLMIYFEKNQNDAKVMGFFTFLSKLENMKLIVLLADILQIYKRYHKLVQSDNLTIVSLVEYIESLKTSLNGLENGDLTGGWAEVFENTMIEKDGKTFLKGFEIWAATGTRPLGKRSFNEIRRAILKTLNDCLQNRFQVDEDLIKIINPFIEFQENANIRQIHALFGADLPLSSLSLEYAQLVQSKEHDRTNLSKQIRNMLSQDDSSAYECVITVLSRINTCTPQSADVERSIKANNLLKTAFRSSLNIETENRYMFVYFNMPPLEKWNPKTAITIWLNDKQRREHLDLIKKDTAKKQAYFKGIFELASMDLDSDSDEEIDKNENEEKKVTF